MFVPPFDALSEILKLDATQSFSPGKRIDSENGADKRFIKRQQQAARKKFVAGELTAADSAKYMRKFSKRFGHKMNPYEEYYNKLVATEDWRHLTVIGEQLLRREIAGGLQPARKNFRALGQFRKLELASWLIRKEMFYDGETKWKFDRLKPSKLVHSRTVRAFSIPSSIEAWKLAPHTTLHPCEFLTLGYFIQMVTGQQYFLEKTATQETPSEAKSVFIYDYLLPNSQWETKSEMWGATEVDRIKSFAERDTTPFISTFQQYISLVAHANNPKLAGRDPEEIKAIDAHIRSNLFLLSVFCCLSIRMRQDWIHWEQAASQAGFNYEDFIHDFRDFQAG